MNLTKPLLMAALAAAASMSFAQTGHATPAHKTHAAAAAGTTHAMSKQAHAKPHPKATAHHHAKTSKVDKTAKVARDTAAAASK